MVGTSKNGFLSLSVIKSGSKNSFPLSDTFSIKVDGVVNLISLSIVDITLISRILSLCNDVRIFDKFNSLIFSSSSYDFFIIKKSNFEQCFFLYVLYYQENQNQNNKPY